MASLLTGSGAHQVIGREESGLSCEDEIPQASPPQGSLPRLHSEPLTVERLPGWEKV